MAIFSLNHSWIGRSTHPAGAAGAYARYITRNEACTVILGARMPLDRQIYAWLDSEERSDRRNARVIDRVIVALPSELSRDQNIELLQAYCERLTDGRASWSAAIHHEPGDADNPHAHIIFRDRDVDTGRRVMMTSEPGSTERLREVWENEVNKALERAGFEARVDRRSLADQGIDREPQIHVGPGAQRLADRDHEFESSAKQITRLIDGIPTEVTVNYPLIDQGKTRFEENEARKLRNWIRAQEEMALNGPSRPEDMPPMERIAQANLRLDGRYRDAMRSGELPAEDGDPITAVIREHMAERQSHAPERAKNMVPLGDERAFAPVTPADLERNGANVDNEELKARKDELAKLKQEPGGAEMLRARDYLNALTWERHERPPTDEELLGYLSWREATRIPSPPHSGGERRKPETGTDPEARAPRRDAADLVAGGGLAVIGKIADSLETLMDGRTGREVEKDETIMAEKRSIEQITEDQQRRQEAEAEKWRKIELQMYLEQRDRERHHERGR